MATIAVRIGPVVEQVNTIPTLPRRVAMHRRLMAKTLHVCAMTCATTIAEPETHAMLEGECCFALYMAY
jgi:hypothetical protein